MRVRDNLPPELLALLPEWILDRELGEPTSLVQAMVEMLHDRVRGVEREPTERFVMLYDGKTREGSVHVFTGGELTSARAIEASDVNMLGAMLLMATPPDDSEKPAPDPAPPQGDTGPSELIALTATLRAGYVVLDFGRPLHNLALRPEHALLYARTVAMAATAALERRKRDEEHQTDPPDRRH